MPSSSLTQRALFAALVLLLLVCLPLPAPVTAQIPTPSNQFEVIERLGQSSLAFVVDGDYLYLSEDNTFRILQLVSEGEPTLIASLNFAMEISAIVVADGRAYLGQREGADGALSVVDVSNPAQPQLIGSAPTARNVKRLLVRGELAYAGTGKGVEVFDITAMPRPLGSFAVSDLHDLDLDQAGDTLYATGGSTFVALDVTDPLRLNLLDMFSEGNYAVQVVGDLVYASATARLRIIDASDPTQLVIRGFYQRPFSTNPSAFADVIVEGGIAYIFDSGISGVSLCTVDVANIATPRETGCAPISDTHSANIKTPAQLSGEQIYALLAEGLFALKLDPLNTPPQLIRADEPKIGEFAVRGDTMYRIDWAAPEGPLLQTNLGGLGSTAGPEPLQDMKYSSRTDGRLLLRGSWLYRFYNGKGPTGLIGMQTIDVSNPAQPVESELFRVPNFLCCNYVRSYNLLFQGDTIYARSMTSISIIDASNPAQLRTTRTISITGELFWGFTVNGARAYIIGNDTLRVADLSDGTVLGRYQAPQLWREPAAIEAVGTTVYVADRQSLKVFDASNPAQIKLVATFALTNVGESYTYQLLYSARHQRLYAYGTSGIYLFDVSVLLEPRLVLAHSWVAQRVLLDGDQLIVGSHTVRLLDAQSGWPCCTYQNTQPFYPSVEHWLQLEGDRVYVRYGSELDILRLPSEPQFLAPIFLPLLGR